jgi:acetyl-CoA carboxylase biotin carboxylase subunit
LRIPFGPGIRDDSGVELNSEVSIFYDPLISKLAAWGRDREESIDRLRRALDEYQVGGIRTTLPFFREIVRDEEFRAARLDTGFITRFNERRATENGDNQQLTDLAAIAAAIHYRALRREAAVVEADDHNRESRWKISGRQAQLNARVQLNGPRKGHSKPA